MAQFSCYDLRTTMADVRIAHRFECSETIFWEKIFFNDAFNREMYLEHLRFQQWEVTARRETDTAIDRTITVTPQVGDLPGAIRSIIGDNLSYREEGVFDKQTRRYRVKVVPNVLMDKLSVQGETWVEELAPNLCNRIFVAEIAVRLFGVGSVIKKRLIADLQLSYNAGATFTAEYIKHHGLAGP